VHDRQTGSTVRISADDGQDVIGRSNNPSISADGRSVAFWTEAPALIGVLTSAQVVVATVRCGDGASQPWEHCPEQPSTTSPPSTTTSTTSTTTTSTTRTTTSTTRAPVTSTTSTTRASTSTSTTRASTSTSTTRPVTTTTTTLPPDPVQVDVQPSAA